MSDLVFAFAVPIGPEYDPRLEVSLKSITQQDVAVRIGVCDASNHPSCKDVLSGYSDYINYCRHGADGGQSEAINEGWRHIEGDIYAWLNVDDYLVPGALQRVASFFDNNPNIDVVFGQSYIMQGDKIIGMHSEVRPMTDDIFFANVISQPSCFIRRQALHDVELLDENLHYTMDWDLWMRLFNAGARFHYMPHVLSMVAWDTDTKTASLSRARYQEIFKLRRRHASISASIRTAISFLLEHMSTFGPFKSLSTALLEFVRKKRGIPSKKWNPSVTTKDTKQGAETNLTILLSHYREHSADSIRLSFLKSSEREFYVNGLKLVESKDKSVFIPVNLMRGVAYDLSIVKSEKGRFGLEFVEF